MCIRLAHKIQNPALHLYGETGSLDNYRLFPSSFPVVPIQRGFDPILEGAMHTCGRTLFGIGCSRG